MRDEFKLALGLRAQLARLELQLAQRRVTRLVLALGLCGLVALAGYILLVTWVANELPPLRGFTPAGTRAVLGGVLFVVGGVSGWLCFRSFCRKYRHFEHTREELQEDVVWISDWVNRISPRREGEASSPPKPK